MELSIRRWLDKNKKTIISIYRRLYYHSAITIFVAMVTFLSGAEQKTSLILNNLLVYTATVRDRYSHLRTQNGKAYDIEANGDKCEFEKFF